MCVLKIWSFDFRQISHAYMLLEIHLEDFFLDSKKHSSFLHLNFLTLVLCISTFSLQGSPDLDVLLLSLRIFHLLHGSCIALKSCLHRHVLLTSLMKLTPLVHGEFGILRIVHPAHSIRRLSQRISTTWKTWSKKLQHQPLEPPSKRCKVNQGSWMLSYANASIGQICICSA